VGFGMSSNGFALILFYPRTALHERIATNTTPPDVDAWLIRSGWYNDFSQLMQSEGDAEVLRAGGREQLSGRVVARYKNNADFNIVVDLTGNKGGATSVRGEFVGRTQTKFDPGSILAGLGMVFFGERHSSMPQTTNAPANAAERK